MKFCPTIENLEDRAVPSHLIFHMPVYIHPHFKPFVHLKPHHTPTPPLPQPVPVFTYVPIPIPTPTPTPLPDSSLLAIPASAWLLNIDMSPVTLPNGTTAPKTAMETPDEQLVVDAINQQRMLAGLRSLNVDARLVAAADIGAELGANAGYPHHNFPDQVLSTSASRFVYVQYNVAGSGENAVGWLTDSSTAVPLWMTSPPHAHNILGVNYTDVGVGEAYDSQGRLYVYADFGQSIPAGYSPVIFDPAHNMED